MIHSTLILKTGNNSSIVCFEVVDDTNSMEGQDFLSLHLCFMFDFADGI